MTSVPAAPFSPIPLPPVFTHSSPPPELLTQGAEALVYRTHFLSPSHPCALKHRPTKPYRHSILDKRLTKHRILSEARILVKCRKEGVRVPGVLALDAEGGAEAGGGGWMMMEWIEGMTVRNFLVANAQKRKKEGHQPSAEEQERWKLNVKALMGKIGKAVAKMHEIGVVHGDLTTSNMILQNNSRHMSQQGEITAKVNDELAQDNSLGVDGDIVLIDFGLAAQSVQDEDKAVDLYVLERAFGSTHPENEDGFQEVLDSYRTSYKGAKVVLKRLEDVRMRGRKRSMVG